MIHITHHEWGYILSRPAGGGDKYFPQYLTPSPRQSLTTPVGGLFFVCSRVGRGLSTRFGEFGLRKANIIKSVTSAQVPSSYNLCSHLRKCALRRFSVAGVYTLHCTLTLLTQIE